MSKIESSIHGCVSPSEVKIAIWNSFISLEGVNYPSFIFLLGTMGHLSPYYNSFQITKELVDYV